MYPLSIPRKCSPTSRDCILIISTPLNYAHESWVAVECPPAQHNCDLSILIAGPQTSPAS